MLSDEQLLDLSRFILYRCLLLILFLRPVDFECDNPIKFTRCQLAGIEDLRAKQVC